MVKKMRKKVTEKINDGLSKPASSKEGLIKTREHLSAILKEIQAALDRPLNDLTPQEVFKVKGCLREKIKDLKKAIKKFVKLL